MCGSESRTNSGESRNSKLILTPERRLEIEQIANLYGPSNCWTGTSGTLAAIIRELLAEIDRNKVSGVADQPSGDFQTTDPRWANIRVRIASSQRVNDCE